MILYRLLLVKRTVLKADNSFLYDNAQIAYSVLGTGKPVVLLHGSMVSNPWGSFEKELAKYYQVFLLNLPGFGGSEAVESKLHNTSLFSEVLCAFLKELNLQSAPIIGFSLGGVVTVRSAVNGCATGDLVLVGIPLRVESKKLKNASNIPIWLRRMVGSTVWGRKKILIPVLRDVTGRTNKKGDEQLLEDLRTTDTKALVDIDVFREVEQQMPAMIKQLKNKVSYI